MQFSGGCGVGDLVQSFTGFQGMPAKRTGLFLGLYDRLRVDVLRDEASPIYRTNLTWMGKVVGSVKTKAFCYGEGRGYTETNEKT
jgi:hypothetical protein